MTQKGSALSDLSNIVADAFQVPDFAQLTAPVLQHKPRILMLYGALRERSYSRLLTVEAQRLLEAFGAEVRVFHANGLPLPNDAPDDHPKVQELREAMLWSEGQVWTSPERHGAMSAVLKAQIDWISLPVAPSGQRRGALLRSCRCQAGRSPSMRSTRCAFSGAGCG